MVIRKVHDPGNALHDQFYWVAPVRLMAGCYPGSEDMLQARQKLTYLIEQGVGHVINLMESGEVNRSRTPFVPYAPLMKTMAEDSGLTVTIERMSIRDFSVPSRSQMRRILDSVDAKNAARQAVFVHCLGGIGRTGMVAGCYLLRHALANRRNVLQKIRQLRQNSLYRDKQSPETAGQVEFVLSWAEGE
jgi:hypothetical protein